MNHFNTKKKRSFGALFITFALYFIFSVSGYFYTYTDNITVGVVTSGMYGDNNLCQYLHPLFCLMIKFLNPILPTADVFAVLMHAFILFGIYCILYAAICTAFQKPVRKWGVEDYIAAALFLLGITYFALGLKIFGINYTVQTGAILATGVIVLFYALYTEKSRKWIAAGTILFFGAFLGRIEACLLFLPFLALEFFVEFVRRKNRLEWSKKAMRYLLPAVIVMIVLLGSKAAFLQLEPYKSDAAYNKYRTIVEDYPMETYGVTYKDFTGIDKTTYKSAINWMLIDTDGIDTETLEKIASVGSRNEYQYTKQGIKWTFQKIRRRAFRSDVHVMTMTALVLILTIWNLIAASSIWLKLEALASFAGGFIILFYFTFRGRAPLRVWQCVLIAALSILVLVMIKDGIDRRQKAEQSEPGEGIIGEGINRDETKKKKLYVGGLPVTLFQLFLCIVLYFGIGQVMAHSGIHAPTSPFTAKIGADDSGYADTFEDDALYIWPWWYSTIPDYFSRQDKLPTQRVIEHNIAMGDWLYNQVYFRDFLKRINADNPALALLERPNTYLMEGQEEDFLQYMQEHYGEEIELEQVKEIKGRKVFRLVRGSDDKGPDKDENTK